MQVQFPPGAHTMINNNKENRLTLRELLQQFGFCKSPEEHTLDAGLVFFDSFKSAAGANNLLSVVFHRLDGTSQSRLFDLLCNKFPGIIREEAAFEQLYVEQSPDDNTPRRSSSIWKK